MTMQEKTLHYLMLASVEGLGCRGAHRLLHKFQSPVAIFRAPIEELTSAGLPEFIARSLLSDTLRAQAETELGKCLQNQLQILDVSDPDYPKLLKEIYDPPLVLFCKGDTSSLNTHSVAIVGSRRATPYGINAAEKLGRDLATRGLTIVSGLARGIDTAAHRGAIEAKGKTVAVLGSGFHHIYPRENKKLAEQIANEGCVISELPLNTSPSPQNFPIRNRIISGLSLGTCLVEAAEFSGSLITGRLALEQGREVFAVPGNITSKTSFGPNLWIKQGAKLVQDWQDIVEELPRSVKEQILVSLPTQRGAEQPPLFPEALTAPEKIVLELLRLDEAVHIDRLLETSNLSSAELLSVLFDLELKDKVKQLPGKSFVRKF
jgi:DNA processing protein